jgi:hypothetical protein
MEPVKTDIRLLFLESFSRIDKEKSNLIDYWYTLYTKINELEKENQSLKQRITELIPR